MLPQLLHKYDPYFNETEITKEQFFREIERIAQKRTNELQSQFYEKRQEEWSWDSNVIFLTERYNLIDDLCGDLVDLLPSMKVKNAFSEGMTLFESISIIVPEVIDKYNYSDLLCELSFFRVKEFINSFMTTKLKASENLQEDLIMHFMYNITVEKFLTNLLSY